MDGNNDRPHILASLSLRFCDDTTVTLTVADGGETVDCTSLQPLTTELGVAEIVDAKKAASSFSCLHLYTSTPPHELADIGLPVRLQTFEHVALRVEVKSESDVRLGVDGESLPPQIGRQVRLHNGATFFEINFGDKIGVTTLELWEGEAPAEPLARLCIGIKPRKFADVTGLTEFHRLVEELQDMRGGLLYDLLGVSALPTRREPPTPPTLLQKLRYLRHVFTRQRRGLRQVLRAIAENPDKRLIKERVWRDAAKATASSPAAIESLMLSQVEWYRGTPTVVSGFTPTRVIEEISRVTHDTYPNRFLKFVLRNIARVLTDVEKMIETELYSVSHDNGSSTPTIVGDGVQLRHHRNEWQTEQYERHLNDCRDFRRPVRGMLLQEWLAEVGELTTFEHTSTVLAHDPRYRTIAEVHRELRRGLKVEWQRLDNALLEPVKGMDTLYEIWCFVKLYQLLTAPPFNFQPDRDEPIGKDGNLRENCPIRLRRDDGVRVTLRYQPRFHRGRGSYSVTIKPDIGLEREQAVTILLDAKYRVNWSPPTDASDETEAEWKYEDLWKMHAYRDMIVDTADKLWVLALYPGDRIDLFLKATGQRMSNFTPAAFALLREESQGGVGMLPFVPEEGKVAVVRQILQILLC